MFYYVGKFYHLFSLIPGNFYHLFLIFPVIFTTYF